MFLEWFILIFKNKVILRFHSYQCSQSVLNMIVVIHLLIYAQKTFCRIKIVKNVPLALADGSTQRQWDCRYLFAKNNRHCAIIRKNKEEKKNG